jgi:hypothetical protein
MPPLETLPPPPPGESACEYGNELSGSIKSGEFLD